MNQTTMLLLIAAAVIVLLLIVAGVASRRRQSEELHKQFGPEYDRTVDQYGGDKSKAEQELAARDKRVEAFDIHDLRPEQRQRFQDEWRSTQAEFVDKPDMAVERADKLIQEVMRARGYPVGDFDQRAADLSVNYPNVVTNYQEAHAIALKEQKGQASTEDLRQAMVHYRALFEDLLNRSESDQQLKEAA